MAEELKSNKIIEGGEIDLIEIIRHLWNNRLLILKFIIIFVVVGLFIAFTSAHKFKAEARLLPEIQDTRGGASALLRQFGGFGGLSGLSMPGLEGADAIRPDLYPDVLRSTPFFIALLEHEIMIEGKSGMQSISIFNYVDQKMGKAFWKIVKKYTIKLPKTLKGYFRGDRSEYIWKDDSDFRITKISEEQYEVIKELRSLITAYLDQRSGVITVSAVLPDRWAAAQVADFALEYLKGYITVYRIEKALKELEFIEKRFIEKEEGFFLAQETLAQFRDANRNIISARVQTEEQRLQDQYNLAFNVYNGLAQQLEQARIKVQEETPVMQVLEPVTIPVKRQWPKRGLILVVSCFLGTFVGIGYITGLRIIRHYFNK
jgi:uncharacterized protein involved in exopolysaccharide biosynthesis